MRSRVRLLCSIGLFALAIGACASGGDVTARGGDGGRRDGGQGIDSGETGVCDPPCADGEICSAGSCVPATDEDLDGLDVSVDCDDTDPAVGTVGERPCTGACGDGTEVCTDGLWGECTAPTSCSCEPGTPARTIDCMHCGTQRQICSGGEWVDDGACTGAGPCSPGEIGTGGTCGNCGTERRTCGADCTWGPWACEGEGVCAAGATESEMETCGTCGTGSRSRTRTCSASCTWGTFASWGACSGGGSGVCTPGETDTETRACACGGTETRSRTCDATTCDWGSWGPYGACVGMTGCTPGTTRPCPNGDPCGVQTCSSSCTWSTTCSPNPGSTCMRIRPGTTGPAGNNYRCCDLAPPAGGDQGWQFCLPPDGAGHCFWSTACMATDAC